MRFVSLGMAALIGMAATKPVVADKAKLSLSKDGKTSYVIALASDAIPAEKTAAGELKKYLETVTSATFPIVIEGEKPISPRIYVGAGLNAHRLVSPDTWKKLGPDGILIQSVGKDLVLAGDRPRGSLYAVYEFLEREAGCRWWTKDTELVPSQPTLQITAPNLLFTPPFSYREHFTSAVREDPIFATKMRENGHFQTQDEAWGGHHQVLGWCHTFRQLLPLDKYFKAHPEWYTDPANNSRPCNPASNQPHDEETQLCLTNEAAREELTKQALLWLNNHPSAKIISIAQNDNPKGFCTCPNCSRIKNAEGGESGPLLAFVNQVAEEIGRQRPDVLVETLAYQSTEQPPRTIRPAKNVLIRFAPIDNDFGHPLESESNIASAQSLRDWNRIAHNLYVWNYVTNFMNYSLPHPNWAALGADLKFFSANRVTGVYEQGDPYSKQGGDYLPLRTWLLSKLLWNPNLDRSKLTDEFLTGYYGAAAPFLRQDLDLVETAYLKEKRPLGQINQDYGFLTLDVLNERTRLFNAAEAAVKDQPDLTQRVQRLRLSLELCWLSRYQKLADEAAKGHKPFLGPADPMAALIDFPAKAMALGEPVFSPRGALQNVIPRLKDSLAPKVALPDFARDLPAKDVIDIQQGRFYLYRKNELSFVVPDAVASDGLAASVIGDTEAWAAQAWGSEVFEGGQGGNWHVYAYARVVPKSPGQLDGTGLRAGVYDGGTKKSLREFNVPLTEMASDKYVRIDLGRHFLNNHSYVWFAPQRNPLVSEIRIDRVILVREETQP